MPTPESRLRLVQPTQGEGQEYNNQGEAPTLSEFDRQKLLFGHLAVGKHKKVLEKYGRFVGPTAVATLGAILVGYEVLQFVKKHHGAETDGEALEQLQPEHFDELAESKRQERRSGDKKSQSRFSRPSPRFHIGKDH